MTKFNVNERYCVDLSKKIAFGNIQKDIVVNISQLPQVEILTFDSNFIAVQGIKKIGTIKKLEELYQNYTKTNILKKP